MIRDANTKGLLAIAAETSALAEQARNGKLKPADMQGGCFTISSLGGIGGTGIHSDHQRTGGGHFGGRASGDEAGLGLPAVSAASGHAA